MQHYELLLFFFLIALVYASVGFGGGSSYLAILVLYPIPFYEMKFTALICNIIVVTGGTIIYARRGQLPWWRALPLVAASVPAAFMGARLKLSQQAFFILLGVSLIVTAVLLWLKTREATTAARSSPAPATMAPGAAIGLLSGMVGIGGGIFLSPLLNLLRWDTARHIAATASLFILANSMAGIAGQLSVSAPGINYSRIALLCIAVFAGGQIGSRLGAHKFSMLMIRRATAVLVFIAGVEVLYRHLL